jgi:hypothetical protein
MLRPPPMLRPPRLLRQPLKSLQRHLMLALRLLILVPAQRLLQQQ